MHFKNLLLTFSLFLITLLICLIILEGFSRIFVEGPPKFSEPGLADSTNYPPQRPNWEGLFSNGYVTTNSEGFRGPDYPLNKQKNITRIAFIGDSFVFGHGVNDNETMPFLLESKLKDQDYSVEVMNFGVNGYDLKEEVSLFKDKILKYNPDVLLWGIFLNDIEYTDSQDIQETPLIDKILNNKILNRHFRFFQYTKMKLLQILYKLDIKAPASFDRAIVHKTCCNFSSLAWKKSSSLITEIQAITKEKKIDLIFIIYPHLFNLNDYPFLKLHKAIGKELELHSMVYIDLQPSFQNKNALEFRANKLWDHHYNLKANNFASEEILKQLKLKKIV